MPDRPYASAADLYWNAGWRSPLPLPVGAKKHPPKGFTGAGGRTPSYPDIFTWVEGPEGDGNIALRMPAHIIGIDVDNYGDKDGAETLALAEAKYSPLPPTWRTTSRDDGVSGIRLYRVPEGLAWPGEIGASIEIIRFEHRYALVWPSVHPEGRVYRWIDPDGLNSTHIPDLDDPGIARLPDAWVEGFTGGQLAVATPRTEVAEGAALQWLIGHPHATGELCLRMSKAVDQHGTDLAGSAHNSTRDAVLRIARLTGEGHHGTVNALGSVRRRFLADATDPRRAVRGAHRRSEGEARHEWSELVTSAVGVVLASPSDVATCDCYGQLTGLIAPTVTEPGSTQVAADGTPLDPAPVPETSGAEEHPAQETGGLDKFIKDGASFILDTPAETPAIWGDGQECLWAEGEALMIVGPPGVGKTTVTGQLLRGRLGLEAQVLGHTVTENERRILYLAMDRPQQIARALRRAFHESERELLADRLRFWIGPPPGDVAKHPTVLLSLAELAEADTIIIDSVKDAAVGLTEDEVGAAYNRARQHCLAAGVEVLELHHMVKRGGAGQGSKPTELADVYGSAWLTAGAGSVLLLWGNAGDSYVKLTHLKQPAEMVGPLQLEHDHSSGTTTIATRADPIQMAINAGTRGITAGDFAAVVNETDAPNDNHRKDARRKLNALVDKGALVRSEQPRSGHTGGRPEAHYLAPNFARIPNGHPNGQGGPPESNGQPPIPTDSTPETTLKPNGQPNGHQRTRTPTDNGTPSEGGGVPPGLSVPRAPSVGNDEKPYTEGSCKGCFRPTPVVILDHHDGRCTSCAATAGEDLEQDRDR